MGTFYGLEMAKRALFSQQSAIYTTGHNISNANTDGYSRQRVNFKTTSPFPHPSRTQPYIAGQRGTGVDVGSVQRIRDQFLDVQFRNENSKLGYWDSRAESLKRMENLLNEPTEEGLASVINDFWQSLNDLAVNPDNTGARSVVAQRGLAVAETFNYLAKNLKSIQSDLQSQIRALASETDSSESSTVNSLLKQINEVNEQIQKIEPHGQLANDLYDERDRLIDELSEIVNIKVHYRPSSESAEEIADGIASIELIKENGESYDGDGIFLIDAREEIEGAINEVRIDYDDETDKVSNITIGDEEVQIDEFLQSTGSLVGLVKSYGYEGDIDNDEFNYPHVMEELDKLANVFAEKFNEIHESGEGIDDDQTSGIQFFISNDDGEITAENLTVNNDILKDPNLIAAGEPGQGTQNGDHAQRLADMFDEGLEDLDGASVRKFFTSLIGEVGVNAQEANRMKKNTSILQTQIDHERQSVSAVSLDEEFTNLIKFQHAYNAAARNITAVDEMIDRVINNMGLVGR